LNSGSGALLREELEYLQRTSGLGLNLSLVWSPNPGKTLSGEVKGSIIYVYETDMGKALDTLRHEFFDYCVSQAIQPYRRVTNTMIRLLKDEAYKQKERIVGGLSKLTFREESS
jgi:hypothetical protein